MKQFLLRLSLATAIVLCVTALGVTGNAQAPSSQEPAANGGQNEPRMPSAENDTQTQDAKTFTGRVTKENGKVVLKDPVTKISYQIDDASKVKAYMGKEVKVTGKLDMNSNMIHVESVELLR